MKSITGKISLTEIPPLNRTISFQHPAFKGTYGNVAEGIEKQGLKRSTSAETASLVHRTFKNLNGRLNERLYSEVNSILKRSYLWEFTGNLFLPKSNQEVNNGVILDLNPTFEKRRKEYSLNERISRSLTSN